METEAEILNVVASDENHAVREKAVFALSQLPGGRAVKALIAIVEDSETETSIRKRALFWLAQTESDTALDYLHRLLVGE